MSISVEEVKKVARLARLHLEEDRLQPTAEDLNKIIGFIEQLSEVDTDGVEPLANVSDIELFQREDVVNDGNARDAVLANAPETLEGFYVVPKVVE